MERCAYHYCRLRLDPGVTDCPRCGHPTDASQVEDPAFVLGRLPSHGLQGICDAHQILPTAEGSWELQLAMMDRLSIRRVLLQSVPSGVPTIAGNEALRRIAASHPDRFVISQFSDPRIPLVRLKLRRYGRLGVRVIKVLPCLGFQPDAPKHDRFWGALERHGMAVMAHTGFITARHKAEERRAGHYLNSRWGRPIYWDRVARKFPGLRIVLCHMGGASWYEEACEMVSQHDNVWGDVAGPGLVALRRIVRHEVELDWSRVFWGNDSAPWAYPFNLRLALHSLDTAELRAAVLRDNGRRFLDGLGS